MRHLQKILLALISLIVVPGLIGCDSISDSAKAQDILYEYFSLLHEGKYGEAASLYGGEYTVLEEWNPQVDPRDHAALFELGCTVNGLQCLSIKSIGAREDSAPGIFEFYVQFENQDGSKFVLETIETSASGEPPISDFKFTVVERENGFVVHELPIYLP